MRLFQNQAANGNGTPHLWNGGDAIFVVWGDFEDGTCKLQISPDSGNTWIDVDDSSMTVNGAVTVNLALGLNVRAVLSGSGSPSPDVSATLF